MKGCSTAATALADVQQLPVASLSLSLPLLLTESAGIPAAAAASSVTSSSTTPGAPADAAGRGKQQVDQVAQWLGHPARGKLQDLSMALTYGAAVATFGSGPLAVNVASAAAAAEGASSSLGGSDAGGASGAAVVAATAAATTVDSSAAVAEEKEQTAVNVSQLLLVALAGSPASSSLQQLELTCFDLRGVHSLRQLGLLPGLTALSLSCCLVDEEELVEQLMGMQGLKGLQLVGCDGVIAEKLGSCLTQLTGLKMGDATYIRGGSAGSKLMTRSASG